MDKEEVDFIERFLTRASIQKQWQYARAFVENYGETIHDINRTYLINHVMRISADEPVYLANHASAGAMAARTTALGVGDKWLGCEMLYAGKMNFAIIKHELLDTTTQKKTSVVEKIYHDKNRSGFARETKLLASMPSEALLTPRFLGSHIVEPFYFEYAEFVVGATPSLQVFEQKIHHRALRFLWATTPTPALLQQIKPNRAKMLNLTEVLETAAALDPALCEIPEAPSGDVLRALLTQAHQIYESSPDTVFHDDLHRGNVIAKGDDFFILDWDKWKYEKPGSGAVYRGSEDRGDINSFLERAYCAEISISKREFQSNYLFFNLCHALKTKKTSMAGLFAGLLRDIH